MLSLAIGVQLQAQHKAGTAADIIFNFQDTKPEKLVIQYIENSFSFYIDTIRVKNGKGHLHLNDISAIFFVSLKSIIPGNGDSVFTYEVRPRIFITSPLTRVLISTKQYTVSSPGNTAQPSFEKYLAAVKYGQDSLEKMIMIERFLRANPYSAVSLYAIEEYINNIEEESVKAEKGFTWIHKLNSKLLLSARGTFLSNKLTIFKNTAIGNTAPAFNLKDTSGNTHRLEQFKGRYVLLEFWALRCGPCRKMNPALKELYAKYQGKPFQLISISTDTRREDWVKAITEDKLPWLQLSDLKQKNSQAQLLYGVTAIPRNFLINPDGKVIGKDLSVKEIEQIIDAL